MLVWAAFAASSACAAIFIHVFSGRIPVIEDFYYLDLWLSPFWPDPDALWQPLNEHRLPLPKFVTWATARVFGVGFKKLMLADLTALILVTFYLLRSVSAARGRARLSDIFLPLTLLSIGHAESLLWAVQVNFYAPVVLSLFALGRLVSIGDRITPGGALAIGSAAVGLTLCGVQGAVVALPLAAWLFYATVVRNSARPLGGALASLALVIVAASALTYRTPAHHAEPRVGGPELRYSLRVVGGGWGPAAEGLAAPEPTAWPPVIGLATLALALVTQTALVGHARRPACRAGSLGLAAFGVGYLVLAVGIGTGRSALTGGALANRYMTLMTPLAAWIYVAWVRLAPASPDTARIVQGALGVLALLFAWPNAAEGLRIARDAAVGQALVERDIRLGVPAEFLDAHHRAYLFPPDPGVAGPGLERLREAGVSPFDRIAPPVTYTAVPAAWTPVGVAPQAVDGTVTSGVFELVQYTVRFAEPTPWPAIRLEYELDGPPSRIDNQASWVWTDPSGTPVPRLVRKPLRPRGSSQMLWLGKGVREVTFTVRGPCSLKISRIEGLK